MIDLKLCTRPTPGIKAVSGTSVKRTHAHQRKIVKAVRGIAIAKRSQKLWDKVICPVSFVWTNSVEKKFLRVKISCELKNSGIELLTATIVVGRYIRVMTVKILTAAASFVLFFYIVVRSQILSRLGYCLTAR